MNRPMRSRWEQRVRSPIVGGLFRLCLVISLWHAPVPWVHCHPGNPAGDARLVRHLARFHPSIDPKENLGWHWHFLLPWWCVDAARCLPDGSQTTGHDRPVSDPEFDQVVPAASPVAVDAADEVREWLPAGDALARRCGRGPGGCESVAVGPFLDTFLDSTSMRALLGVARC